MSDRKNHLFLLVTVLVDWLKLNRVCLSWGPSLAFQMAACVMVARRGSACTLSTAEHLAFGVLVKTSRLLMESH